MGDLGERLLQKQEREAMKIIYLAYISLFITIGSVIIKEWKNNNSKKKYTFNFCVFILLGDVVDNIDAKFFLDIYKSDNIILETSERKIESSVQELFDDDFTSMIYQVSIIDRLYFFMTKPDIKISFYKECRKINSINIYYGNNTIEDSKEFKIVRKDEYIHFSDEFNTKVNELVNEIAEKRNNLVMYLGF